MWSVVLSEPQSNPVVVGLCLLARIVHGLGGNGALHNPATFELDLVEASTFEVRIGEVSGWGGAALQLYLDGQLTREVDFTDPDDLEDKTTLLQYEGDYTITVPAGKHTVKVENTGADWFEVLAYRIPNVSRSQDLSLRALGVTGDSRALVWVQNKESTWNRLHLGLTPRAQEGAGLRITGLQPGIWRVERYDTSEGKVVEIFPMEANESGVAAFSLPAIATDTAYRLIRESQGIAD